MKLGGVLTFLGLGGCALQGEGCFRRSWDALGDAFSWDEVWSKTSAECETFGHLRKKKTRLDNAFPGKARGEMALFELFSHPLVPLLVTQFLINLINRGMQGLNQSLGHGSRGCLAWGLSDKCVWHQILLKIFVCDANCLCHPSPCCQLCKVLEVFLSSREFLWKENNLDCTFDCFMWQQLASSAAQGHWRRWQKFGEEAHVDLVGSWGVWKALLSFGLLRKICF